MELEQCSSSLLELSGVMDDSVSSLKHRMSNQQKGNTKMNNKHISSAAFASILALQASSAVVSLKTQRSPSKIMSPSPPAFSVKESSTSSEPAANP